MSDRFINIELRNLSLSAYDADGDIDLGPETLDTALQSRIDSATTIPSDLPRHIHLHPTLPRWSAYAGPAIKLLERQMTRPGYLDDGGDLIDDRDALAIAQIMRRGERDG